jgi:hypothetical protein
MDAGDFPVSGCAVLSGRGRPHATPRANGIVPAKDTFEWLDVPETEALQPRQRQASSRTGDVAKRVAAGIPVASSVWGFSDPDAVEDDDRCAFQLRSSV